MPFINADRIKETTTTTGTGAITLAGAVLGFRAFYPTLSVGDTFKYFIVSTSGTEWESGLGTLTASSTLARTTVQSSSNVNPLTAVNFSAGLKEVGIGPTAGGETPWNPVTNTLDISVNALNDVAITSPTVNQVLKYSGTEWTNQADAVNVGTVTSVSGAGTVSGLTLTGTVTSSGSLTLGGAISTLNQNTTGSAATVTTNANLTGHVTSVGNAAVLGSFTSAQLAGALSDETGTGAAVFATSPTLVTPLSNSLSAVPVASGAGNSLTIAAGSGIGTGSGANLVLNPGEFATSGTRGTVLIDGLNAGKSKSSGTNNTVFGNSALAAITTGNSNTASGFRALFSNTTGNENTANGLQALYSNITGYYNVATGISSLYKNTGGDSNVAIGYAALFDTTGSRNTATGFWSGGSITTGSNNTFFGFESGFNASQLATASNSMALGNGAFTTASNQVVIGNTSVTQIILNGTATTNAIAAIPVASGAGNSLTIAAGSGVTSGAGGSLILQAGLQATSGGDGKVIVKQVAGQTSNLQEWQNSAGTALAVVTPTGRLGIGTANPSGVVDINLQAGQAFLFNSPSDYSTFDNNFGYYVIGNGQTTFGFISGGAKIMWGAGSASFQGTWNFPSGGAFPEPLLASNGGSGGDVRWAITKTGNGASQTIYALTQVYYDNGVGPKLVIGANGIDFALRDNSYWGEGIDSTAMSIAPSSGNIGIGTVSPNAKTHIVTAAATKGLIVQGAASQTAALQEWQNSSGTALASVDAAGNIRTTALTVTNLSAAATAGAGARAFVSDSNATTFAAVVAGGGANGVPVYSDGTNWRIG